MKRSAAPSRRNFVATPIQNSSPLLTNKEIGDDSKNVQAVLNAVNKTSEVNEEPTEDGGDAKRFCDDQKCSQNARRLSVTCQLSTTKEEPVASGTNTTRFSAVWTKLSSRKHKIWEGDCIVITDGRSTTVKDADGKIIGVSNSAFKNAKINEVESGYRFVVSGKEVEICSRLVDEEEKFTIALTTKNNYNSKPERKHPRLQRNFIRDENSFVLPRPSPQHCLKHNFDDAMIVDVIVDRRLTQNLRPHQKEGVVFLYQCVVGLKDFDGYGAILADEMGLGKTLQCITCLWTLLKQGPYGRPIVRRCLIIVPSSLVNNWVGEFKKWLGPERIKISTAKKTSDVKSFVDDVLSSVLIISYDLVIRCQTELEQISFDLLICDEGHRLKNSGVKTNFVLTSLPIKRRILLSGTPLQNDLNELFTLSEFVNPGILGSRSEFRRGYENLIVKSQQPDTSDEEKTIGCLKVKELNDITQQFLLRRTSELNKTYLPPKIEYVLFCKPSPTQTCLYEKLLESVVVKRSLSENNCHFLPEHLMCIDAMRKLCNHPALFYNSQIDRTTVNEKAASMYEEVLKEFSDDYRQRAVSVADSGKLQCLFDLLTNFRRNNADEKVVIVSNFTSTLDLLGSLCDDMKYKYLRLDGSTIGSARMKLVNQFNSSDDDTLVFLLSSKAGGLGLNLIGANRIVLYDIDWNPANDLQSMARIWRDGQKRTCHIYRLLTTGTIEEKMFQRQIKKQNLSGSVVDLKNDDANNIRFSSEELKDIFTLNVDTNCQTHDLLKCQCGGVAIEQDHVLITTTDPTIITDQRSCQLGSSCEPISKKLPGMSRLLEWQHRSGESLLTELLPDESCLESNCSISFVLYNTNTSNDASADV